MTSFPGGLVWYKISDLDADAIGSTTFINPDEIKAGSIFPAVAVRLHSSQEGGKPGLLARKFESADINVMLPGGVFFYIPGVVRKTSTVDIEELALSEDQPEPGCLSFSCPLSLQVLI